MRLDAFGRDFLGNGSIERRVTTDQRNIEPVALVAAAGVGDPVKRDLDCCAHAAPTKLTVGATRSRSTRHDALARRGVMVRRTPAPPAGPAQYRASTSSSRSSIGSRRLCCAA